MESKILKTGASLIMSLFVFLSCDKPFSLDLPLAVDSREYSLSTKAGQARVFFYTNRAWTLSLEPADCSWASVSRTSGNGKDAVEELLITYSQNSSQDRQVALVITAGDQQEKIIISQKGVVRDWWDGSSTVDDLVVVPCETENNQ